MKAYKGKDVKISTSDGEEIDINSYTLNYDYDEDNFDFDFDGVGGFNNSLSGNLSGFTDPASISISFKVIYLDKDYFALKSWIEGRKDKTLTLGYYERQEDNSSKSIELEDLPEEAQEEVAKELV